MRFYKVSGLLSGSDDQLIPFSLKGRNLLLIYTNGRYSISKRYCPHAGADLANGWCKEGKLVCPHHRYQYDLETGRGAPGQNDYLEVYPLEIRPDGIYVGIAEPILVRLKKFLGL